MSDAGNLAVNHLPAGGESGHEVNGQLPNDHNTSSSQPNAKSHSFSRTKDGLTQQQLDREERLRIIKEKQNEERQKKLEELKQQALAAQKYREKTEEDRRRRIDDLRCRENDRRHQVEERKRLIIEAERDRREAILRRNMEREARIESKRKMERSSIVFAFGSSTPRMLEPPDSGSTYWASRRATSTTNVMSMSVANPGPLTRRSSERELANGKKRATSAGGLLDRKNADGSRSGETTPRPQSALSQHSGGSSVSGTSRPRPSTAPARKQRPISIAVTGVTSNIDPVKQAGNGGKSPLVENRTPIPKVHVTKKSTSKADSGRKTEKPKSSKSSVNTTPKETPLQSPTMELSTESSFSGSESGDRTNMSSSKTEMTTSVSNSVEKLRPPVVIVESAAAEPKSDEFASSDGVSDLAECDMTGSMTSSQIKRITTEEEAKAALAERRRLAREQAEREAELEQQRLEAERLAEEERLRREEEEQRKMEEEQLRMLEEAKRAEEERLSQAIEEKQKREEEERVRKEEELKLKLEKEEADKKAKEEAEKLRQEMEIKLKKEEEDRQARRKRVEAIMSRTRAKGGTPSVTPSKDNGNDITDEKLNGVNNNNKVISDSCSNNSLSENDQFLAAERNENISSSDSTTNAKQNGVHHTVESRNVTNNLLDLTDFDVINTNMIPSSTVSPQIIDLAVSKENYNSNQQDIPDLLS